MLPRTSFTTVGPLCRRHSVAARSRSAWIQRMKQRMRETTSPTQQV